MLLTPVATLEAPMRVAPMPVALTLAVLTEALALLVRRGRVLAAALAPWHW